MSAKQKDVVIGGEPRIDFLPPEIKQKKEDRRRIRGLSLLVVLVIAVCLLAYGGVSTVSIASQARLDAERDRTLELIAQQGKYAEARAVAATVETAKAARVVASAPEIAWSPYLAMIQGSMPEGAVVTQIVVESELSNAAGPGGIGPLALPSVARLTLLAHFPDLGSVATWQNTLESTLGHAGVWSSTFTADGEGFEVQAVIDVSSEAFTLRFFDKPEAGDDAETSSDSAEGGN